MILDETSALTTVSDVSTNQPFAYNAPGSLAKKTPKNLPPGVVHLSPGVSFLPPQPVLCPPPPPQSIKNAPLHCFKCNKIGHMQSYCPEYQCPYCRKWAPGHYQKDYLKRAIRMQNTRTHYARRRAAEQQASSSHRSPSPPPRYDEELECDEDIYTYEDMGEL